MDRSALVAVSGAEQLSCWLVRPQSRWLPGEVADGVSMTPFLSLNGVLTFAETNTATVLSGQPGIEDADLRGVVEVGIDIDTDGGFKLSASGSYDSIGVGGHQAVGGKLTIGQAF